MKQSMFFILIVICLIHTIVEGQVISKNLSLADFVSYQTLYDGQTVTPSAQETITDIASWRDDSAGKEYALVCLVQAGSGSGVAVVDVTNPNSSVYVKTIQLDDPAPNTPTDVKVYNDIAFVAQDGVSNPTYWVKLDLALLSQNLGNPSAGVIDTTDIGNGKRIHNLFVNAEQKLLFLSDFRGDRDVPVYDISGLPNSAPNLVGAIPQLLTGVGSRSHDLYALKLSSATGRVFDATLVSVTVTDYTWSNGVFTVGSARAHEFNPRRGESPKDFTNVITPEAERLVHGAWIGQDSDYLFATVEGNSGDPDISTWVSTGAIQYQRANYLSVWDINPINPSADGNGYRYPIRQVYEVRENSSTGDGDFASSYFTELSNEKCNSIHNIVTRGTTSADTAFISYYTKGIRVLDVTDPTNMSEIAYYDVAGVSQYVYPVFNGTWGVDPFLPSGIILGSSSDGLYVFRKPGAFAGAISADTRWSGTITVTGNVSVSSGVTLTVDPGTVVNFASGTRITVYGTLNVNGTSSNLVTFTRSGASGTWDYIKFQSSGSGTISYATIEYARKGIWCYSDNVTIENCTIEDFTQQGVYAVYSDITVQNCVIQNPNGASHGIYLYGSGSPTISGNTISGLSGGSIAIYRIYGNGTFSGNTINSSFALS